MAATYIHGHGEPVLRSHRWRTVQNSAAYLLPYLRPGHRLLDVGSGPGTITADLARLVGPEHLTALERTEDALALTRAELERQRVAGPRLLVGDATDLPLPDDSVDVVHAHQVLQHVADPVAVLRQMLRVCRPDGVVAARDADYAAFAWYPRHPALDRWMRLYQSVARAGGGDPDAGRALYAWARAAGAAWVVPSTSTWLHVGEEARWWGELWADRVSDPAGTFARTALERGLADQDELAALADGWREWAGEPDAWFCLLHGEVLCGPAGDPPEA
ncbi:class I SAM-dependent methyltransferase [Ornithinicoccus halotolerans]|uniref:class I SAM-dependent methyltransferase n=1 Tax=Ornithinicoccus halotolerans TaxID=1748220 RepID=UPI001297186D|nr:methyltransferase domain-containing protein [Ornithinicoccus halotolerans]